MDAYSITRVTGKRFFRQKSASNHAQSVGPPVPQDRQKHITQADIQLRIYWIKK